MDIHCLLLDNFGGIEERITRNNRDSINKSVHSAFLEDKVYSKEVLIKLDKIGSEVKAIVILIKDLTENKDIF